MIKMKTFLLGAIAGDMIGSPYESRRWRIKTTEFPLFQRFSRFTDDTVLTVATMDCLLHGGKDYAAFYKKYARKYPDAGFGKQFKGWMYADNSLPYNSWGNGSAMRVSPVGWAFGTLDETLAATRASAEVTHNHPEGIRGAEAVAACIFLARNGKTKDEIREYVENTFGYDLRRTCREIRPTYRFDSSCQGSVPEAIICFLESRDYEECVRLAVSLGGDSDTLAAIGGGIAEAYYRGVPEGIGRETLHRLPDEFLEVIRAFSEKYESISQRFV